MPPATIEARYVVLHDAGDQEYAHISSRLLPEERDEASRYRRTQDRLAFAIGRLLVRNMLALYLGEHARSRRFVRTAFGKPTLAPGDTLPNLHFNISHTAGLVVAAVSLDHELGIDVESSANSRHNGTEIARSYFSQPEIDLLESLSTERQPELFYKLWTLKEAYIKARGRGLSEGLSTFSFVVDPPAISFPPQSPEDPNLWFFHQQTLSSPHTLAIAARRLHHGEQIDLHLTELALQELF